MGFMRSRKYFKKMKNFNHIEFILEKLEKSEIDILLKEKIKKALLSLGKTIKIEVDDFDFYGRTVYSKKDEELTIKLSKELLKNFDFSYILLHEILHIVLLDFLELNFEPDFFNLLADIEVNGYVDKILGIYPEFSEVMLKKFKIINKNPKRKHAFFLNLISTNFVEDYGMDKFIKDYLWFIDERDQLHWVEFFKKRRSLLVNSLEILDEAMYWDVTKRDLKKAEKIFSFLGWSRFRLKQKRIKVDEDKSELVINYSELNEKLRKFLVSGKEFLREKKLFPKRSVVPATIGRRELLMLSQGIDPVFYKRNIMLTTLYYTKTLLLYVDVSISMRKYFPDILKLIAHIKNLGYAKEVYLFSNNVMAKKVGELLKEKIFIAGGTNIESVFEDFLKRSEKMAVLVTDGIFIYRRYYEIELIKRGKKFFLIEFTNNIKIVFKQKALPNELIGEEMYIYVNELF